MVEQDPNAQGVEDAQAPIPYVTADMAWEMAKKAAAEAREEAIRETRSQPQPQIQPQSQPQIQPQPQSQLQTQDNRNVQNDRSPRRNRDNYDDRDYRDDDYEDRRVSRRRRRDDDEEQEDLVGFSPKLVKQLQTTVGVFNTLKDFASNPMQKAIEDRIGGLAAGIIENAFSAPRGPPPKRDMMDTLLNSQMAFGIGQGLGSRAPELVESLSKSFGKEKASNMIEGMIGKYTGEQPKRQEPVESDKSSSRGPSGPPKSEDQSNIELLLSLDPNNPEHVAAYSESQGGISIDVARKMLMIHQDDIIKRMESQGADTTVIKSQRGSRIGQDHPQGTYDSQIPPVSQREQTISHQQVGSVSQVRQQQTANPEKHTVNNPVRQPIIEEFSRSDNIQENMQFMEQSANNIPNERSQYAEYDDIDQKENSQNIKSSNNIQSDSQQAEMMKSFAEDIGKVMGDVIGKIEGLNNTVFNLQNELNEMKKRAVQPSGTQNVPTNFDKELEEEARHASQLIEEDKGQQRTTRDFFPDDFSRELEKETTLISQPSKDQSMNSAPNNVQERDRRMSTQDFFPEKIQNIHDFERELEKETRMAVTNLVKKESTDVIQDKNIDVKNIGTVPIKKSIISMINKKNVGYSLKQKIENVEPKKDNRETTNIDNTIDNDDTVNDDNNTNIGNTIDNDDTVNDDNNTNSDDTIDRDDTVNDGNAVSSIDVENDNDNK